MEEDNPESSSKASNNQDDKAELLRKIKNYYRKDSPTIVEEVISK